MNTKVYISLVFFFFTISLHSQKVISEEYDLKNDNITLPGTLTYPKTDTKIPLLIFVHGSGNVDRNGNQAGTFVQANYIKILSDSLNKKGIAFYSYDKRTATPANISISKNILLSDFVADVNVAIEAFKNDIRFSSLHLIGHSQGSLVAMLAITDKISSYTSLAGPATSIDKTIISQLKNQNEELSVVAKEHFVELKKTDTIQELHPFLIQLLAPQNQKFIASWMRFEPAKEIKDLELPILILQGENDLQVTSEDAKLLQKANPKAELHVIPKMNHVLKEVNSLAENNKAYSDATFPLSSKLVSVLSNFILLNQY